LITLTFFSPGFLEDHVELGLLLGHRRRRGGSGRSRGNRRCRGNAEFLFHRFYEVNDLHDAHRGDCVQNVVFGHAHFLSLLKICLNIEKAE
jgi:hypothetical protein